MSFKDLGLSHELVQAVGELGYDKPTPIQEKAIPYVLMGRDVLGCAQTGTGKTASFTLPMIDILASGRAKARMPRSLILEPTRELAAQVGESFEKYGSHHKLSMALLIGGESMAQQEKKLDRGVDVLIATPGRLIDLFERGKIIMADARILVIDEADRMLDMGFIPDVEKIVARLPFPHQTLFFSATMPPEIKKLADKFLLNPKEISVAPPASPAATVVQRLVRCRREPQAKRAALRQLIEREEIQTALIFCNRKRDVDILRRSLERHGYDAQALHGDMAQPKRMETLDDFRKGKIKFLVCSDVAARGLDIPAVSHVFNFDVPSHAEDYIHRIGRTGRAGRSGASFTIATSEDGKLLAAVERMLKRKIEELKLDGAGTDVAKPQQAEEANVGRDMTEASVETEAEQQTAATSRKATTESNTQKAGTTKPARSRRRKSASKASPKPSVAENGTKPEVTVDAEAESKPKTTARAGKKAESKPQTSSKNRSDRYTTPFGDDTPAFLLRPVPLVA